MKANFIQNYYNPSSLYFNEEEKWLWLRIHKTAGTSMYDGFLRGRCINISKTNLEPAAQWLHSITDALLDQYTIWTCVRNPYDRFNSAAAMFNLNPNKLADQFFEIRHKQNIIKRHTECQHIFTHYQGKQVPGYVLRFENLQSDFKALCKKLNLPQHTLAKLNKSQHDHYTKTLNPKTIDFINNFYQLDFKYFNYQKI